MTFLTLALALFISSPTSAEGWVRVDALDHSCMELKQIITELGQVEIRLRNGAVRRFYWDSKSCHISKRPRFRYIGTKDGTCHIGWVCQIVRQ